MYLYFMLCHYRGCWQVNVNYTNELNYQTMNKRIFS